jgi:4-oxalocrotonate tautomerase
MPLIHITLTKGRTKEQIEELIHGVTNTVANVIEVPKDKTWVVINEVETEHWGLGGKSIEKGK